MDIEYVHLPHPWTNERRKHRKQTKDLSLNDKIAVRVTKAIGSMWCAYVFCCLALVSLPAAIASHDPVVLVAWISQTFLQLVLLAVIMVGQDVQSRSADKRAELTYKDADATLHEAEEIQRHLVAQDIALAGQDKALEQLIEQMQQLVAAAKKQTITPISTGEENAPQQPGPAR